MFQIEDGARGVPASGDSVHRYIFGVKHNFDPISEVCAESRRWRETEVGGRSGEIGDLTRTLSYDARGNLVRTVERNGRVIDYGYDSLSRKTSETWYDDVEDADTEQIVRKTYAMQYDPAGRVAAVGDGDYDFQSTWSIFGNLTSTTQDLTGQADDVVFSYAYEPDWRSTLRKRDLGEQDGPCVGTEIALLRSRPVAEEGTLQHSCRIN